MEIIKSLFDENEIDQNNSELKSFIINFELESGHSIKCKSEGNTPEEAIENAIKANPTGKNFIIAPKPIITHTMYGMSANKKIK